MAFLDHLSISFLLAVDSFARFNYSFHVSLRRVSYFSDLWISHHQQTLTRAYLDAFLRVLDGAEKEGAVNQWVSVVDQHHFFAQDARHMRLLVGCQR